MTTIIIPLVILLVAEFIGDFLLQSRETALAKSSDNKVLFEHVLTIFLTLCGTAIFLGGKVIPLALIYCALHALQDKYIWNGYKYLVHKRIKKKVIEENCKRVDDEVACPYDSETMEGIIKQDGEKFVMDKEYAEDKAFYDTIGLDRVLHVITLLVCYGMLFL